MEGTIAEIRMFAGTFAPNSWAFCQGQILSIASNTALFSLLGTTYGGNGQTTFALPDFRGRVAVGTGQGPGLSNYVLGQISGTENTTLISTNLPAHNHQVTGNINMQANNDTQNSSDPTGRRLAGAAVYTNQATELVNMQPLSINLPTTIAGNNQPINNIQPYLAMNFVICLQGIYPSRN